ncbi:MAG: hypothetical protein NT075_25180 [Chloroflexi bacterium]|nr:hypothetical protein [Chloroflexota bacterium]
MQKQPYPQIWICLHLVWVLLLTSLLPPFSPTVAFGQVTPPACLNDRGDPVAPNPAFLEPGWTEAWVLELNFNHAPSISATTGCLGTISASNPQQVVYTLLQCPLQNNINQVPVGNGLAAFDGNFWIECPGIQPNSYPHKNGAILGRGKFNTPASYTLVNHPNVRIVATLDASSSINLTSTYGSATFANLASYTNFAGKLVAFKSEVNSNVGSHAVNGRLLKPQANVPTFTFDESQPFTIGAQGQSWLLYELTVDPPGGCCKQ